MPNGLTQEILIKCNVNLFGHGDEVIVFCQSINENQNIWRHQLHELGKYYKCLTFDFVGIGKSDIRTTESQRYISIQHHLEDFLAIIDRLKIDVAQFVGHGLGGNIGLLAAHRRPQLFKNMHLIDVSPKYLRCADYPGYYVKEDFESIWKVLAREYLSWNELSLADETTSFKDIDKRQALYLSLKTLRPDFAEAALRIVYDLDIRSILPEINSQLHFFHSLNEPTVPLWTSEYYDENVPGSIVQILNSEGQQPQLTAPDEVNEKLKVYLLRKAYL